MGIRNLCEIAISVISAVVDMEVEGMKVTLGTSTGAEIEVWREMELFHVRRVDRDWEAEICWGIDLFEVIAELAQLDLHDRAQAVEALRLAAEAEHRLPHR